MNSEPVESGAFLGGQTSGQIPANTEQTSIIRDKASAVYNLATTIDRQVDKMISHQESLLGVYNGDEDKAISDTPEPHCNLGRMDAALKKLGKSVGVMIQVSNAYAEL